jgi:phosphoglucomutase
MDPLTYNPYLLISTDKSRFSIVTIQTDNTLSLSDKRFSTLEDEKLEEAKFTAKQKELLSNTNTLQFNGCIILTRNGTLSLRQKGQGAKIKLIDTKALDF